MREVRGAQKGRLEFTESHLNLMKQVGRGGGVHQQAPVGRYRLPTLPPLHGRFHRRPSLRLPTPILATRAR